MPYELVRCKNPECRNSMLAVTAAAHDGFCGPCFHEKKAADEKEARDRHIRENTRHIDLYQGVTDPVEMIQILFLGRREHPLIEYAPPPRTAEELFSELAPAQVEELMNIAIAAIGRRKSLTYAEQSMVRLIELSLAALTTANLDPLLHAWLDHHEWGPPTAFRGAGSAVRDRVITRLLESPHVRHSALQSLAWIGDPVSQQALADSTGNPPSAHFTSEAGWELTPKGRRDLCYEECFISSSEPNAIAGPSVRLWQDQPNSPPCPWCGATLTHLIEIPASDPRFAFLEFPNPVLPVLACDRCVAGSYSIYARVSPDGTAVWHHGNHKFPFKPRPKGEWDGSEWAGKTVTLQSRQPIPFLTEWDYATQVGGIPDWILWPEFPRCLDCSSTMRFLASVNHGGREGIDYLFWCPACRITATMHQEE